MGPGGQDEPRGGVGYADLHALSADEQQVAISSVGVPQQVSTAGTLDAFPITEKWLDALDTDLANGDLDKWAARVAGDEDFAAIVFRTLMMGDMGGQLFVRTVEVPETVPRAVRLAVEVPQDAFFNLPFEEAIRAFLERGLVTPEEYRQLSASARARAFSVSQLTSTELVKRIRDLLTAQLEEGGTYRDFVQSVRAGEVDLGVTPTAPSYLETIFRTNTASAYGAGRLSQLTNPVVMAARPYLEFRTARDSRVSQGPDGHAQLEGVIFEQSDPGWRAFSPPLRWNCRCTVVSRRSDAVDASRVVLASTLPRITAPGFGAM